MAKKLVGYVVVPEDYVYHRADFETAAWYEDVEIKAGKYPVRVYSDDEIELDGGEVLFRGCYVEYSGTIVSDYFGTLFYGVPVGEYDSKKNAGQHTEFSQFMYGFNFAEKCLSGKAELVPEYIAEPYSFKSSCDGSEIQSARIRRAA